MPKPTRKVGATKGFAKNPTSPEKDPAYLGLGRILTAVRIDPEALKAETIRIHKARETRKLDPSAVTGKALVKAGVGDGARRSRLVEIGNLLRTTRQDVAKAFDAVHLHVLTTYGRTHFTDQKTIQERKDAVYNMALFVQANDLLGHIDGVLEAVTYAIEDIDKSGFNLNLCMRALELGARGRDF